MLGAARGGGEVVVNPIKTLEKRDVLKKDKTNFLGSLCARVKLVAAVLGKKTPTMTKNPNANV